MWFSKLVPVVMSIARAGSKSGYVYEETFERGNTLRVLIETIPANVTTATGTTNEVTNVLGVDENNLAMVAPPMS
jgi:hypothetical protein